MNLNFLFNKGIIGECFVDEARVYPTVHDNGNILLKNGKLAISNLKS